jgi:hypothetical protein
MRNYFWRLARPGRHRSVMSLAGGCCLGFGAAAASQGAWVVGPVMLTVGLLLAAPLIGATWRHHKGVYRW